MVYKSLTYFKDSPFLVLTVEHLARSCDIVEFQPSLLIARSVNVVRLFFFTNLTLNNCSN